MVKIKSKMKVILGGGISGLAAGYYLRKKFPRDVIKLYESGNRVGGWIKSKKLPNGVIFEQGPRTLRPRGKAGHNTLHLIDEIGISEQIKPIVSTHPAAKNRMIYVNGQLHTLPSSFKEIFQKFSPFSKPLISYILKDLIIRKKTIAGNDESIYSFVERRFGKEIAQYAISPMICGICAGDAKSISVKFLMESIFDKEQKYGGVLKGLLLDAFYNGFSFSQDSESSLVEVAKKEKWSVYSFDGGMELLPQTLKKKLAERDVTINLNTNCKSLKFTKGSVHIQSRGSPMVEIADHVVSSIPAHKLATLLEEQHPKLAALLKKIRNVDVAVVNLEYQNNYKIQDAFGFLVPPSENLPILGVIFDSCCFPNKSETVLTVMMGGHWFANLFGTEPREEYLLETARKQIKDTLGIYEPPNNYQVNILRNCIPQYVVGHNAVIKQIEYYIKLNKLPLSLCGSSYYGIGVNDVIFSAKNAVDNIL